MNCELFPIGWRWLNPVWWLLAWAERRHRHTVRLAWLVAYAELCRDDLLPFDRKYWTEVLRECDAEMDSWE